MAAIERGGIASFYLDGAYYEVKADMAVKLGGVGRKPVPGAAGNVAGFTTETLIPDVTMTALDGPAVSVSALKAVNGNTTLQIKLNNGKSYIVYGAFQIDDPDIKVDAGEIGALKFSGTSAVEITA